MYLVPVVPTIPLVPVVPTISQALLVPRNDRQLNGAEV